MAALELLGASHIVVAAQDLDRAEALYRDWGFERRGEAAGLSNPPGKAGVVRGPMTRSCTMRLMTRPDAPAVELVREEGAEEPESDDMSWQSFWAPPAPDGDPAPGDPVWCAGLRETLGEEAGRTLALRCPDLAAAGTAWRCAGLELEPLDGGRAQVTVPRSLIGSALRLVYCEDPGAPAETWLNSPGVSASAFFCKDADRLWEAFTAAGLEPGQPFDLEPFGRAIRIFFLRNASGEILEFLSARRTGSRVAAGSSTRSSGRAT